MSYYKCWEIFFSVLERVYSGEIRLDCALVGMYTISNRVMLLCNVQFRVNVSYKSGWESEENIILGSIIDFTYLV